MSLIIKEPWERMAEDDARKPSQGADRDLVIQAKTPNGDTIWIRHDRNEIGVSVWRGNPRDHMYSCYQADKSGLTPDEAKALAEMCRYILDAVPKGWEFTYCKVDKAMQAVKQTVAPFAPVSSLISSLSPNGIRTD